MRDVHKALAANVRRLRLARGFSQQKLADLAAVSRSTILAIEAGRRMDGRPTMVTLDTAARLAHVLGATLDELVA